MKAIAADSRPGFIPAVLLVLAALTAPTRLTAADATPPRAFVALDPCRIVDTRGNGAPIQGGVLTGASDVRTHDIEEICGIPKDVDAVLLNLTVVGPVAAGSLVAWKAGPPAPLTAILHYVAGRTVANAAIVPVSDWGAISVRSSARTHLLVDVNGYFSERIGAPHGIFRLTTSGLLTMGLTNLNPEGTAALMASGYGRSGSGVFGFAGARSGVTYGVRGLTDSPSFNSAGVLGIANRRLPNKEAYRPSGVRGESPGGDGVIGLAIGGVGVGVAGAVFNSTPALLAEGYLGFSAGGGSYGVYSVGHMGATGVKYFVEPHPEKADTVIRYVALEGPESGTYFRGKGRFRNGLATIEVPEDFRLVTDPEGLSVQVTPIGEMATVAVVRIGLDGIDVKGSQNVEFFYTVNGVRKSHKNLKPVGPGREYMPASADARMPEYLTEVQKQMLISNGTYQRDGTVNLEKARAMGWDKVWEERSKQKYQPTDPLEPSRGDANR